MMMEDKNYEENGQNELDPTTADAMNSTEVTEGDVSSHAGERPTEPADVTEESSSTEKDSVTEGEPDSEADAEGTLELSELDTALLKVAELEEQLARRNADLYNLKQEYNSYVRRSKDAAITQRDGGIEKVLEILLPTLDDAFLARQHDDLTGPAGTIIDKLEATLKTNFKLERYGEIGEEFDPQIHEALMSQSSADATREEVAQLIQPGYKVGDKVLRPARVGVLKPE